MKDQLTPNQKGCLIAGVLSAFCFIPIASVLVTPSAEEKNIQAATAAQLALNIELDKAKSVKIAAAEVAKVQADKEAAENETERVKKEAIEKEAADKVERARVAAIKSESDAAKRAKAAKKAIAAAPTSPSCDPSYPTICIPPNSSDLNCSDIPNRRFKVVGVDAHRFDRDDDGIGCES